MTAELYDAHNHVHDERLQPQAERLWEQVHAMNIRRMVVNGSSEEDWPQVRDLAKSHPEVLPSFGYHPWYISKRSADWERTLNGFLDSIPSGVGEIGLDRWIQDYDIADQEKVFRIQLRIAAERNLPVTIHCLQTWGKLYDILREESRPARGFLLHSFGGPPEMIKGLSDLGAYFSLPGYYAHARKTRQRQTFIHVPIDRLLIETDAPDQPLPEERIAFPIPLLNGKPVNHPANLGAVYAFAAELLDRPVHELAGIIAANFERLFGGLH
jgi:TatD DNase family protein